MNLNYEPGAVNQRVRRRKLLKFGIPIAVLLGLGYFAWFMWLKPNGGFKDQYGIPTSHVTYDWAHARPEATLYYPGAKVSQPFGEDDSSGDFTDAGAVLEVQASPDQIYAWYATWLLAHGWQHGAGLGLGSTQTSLQNYTKSGSREGFYVAMDYADVMAKTQGIKSAPGMTVFEISYSITPGSGQ